MKEFGDTKVHVVCTRKGKFLYRGEVSSLEFTCTGHCSCIEAWIDRAEILTFKEGSHTGQSLASTRDELLLPRGMGVMMRKQVRCESDRKITVSRAARYPGMCLTSFSPVASTSSVLNFWNLYVYIFHPIWEMFGNYFSKYFFLLHFLSQTPVEYARPALLPTVPFILFSTILVSVLHIVYFLLICFQIL